MSDTESFESVYERLYPQLHNPCGLWKAATIAEWLDDLERAHDREIRDVSQREYDRGYHAGQHSMDAEHRAIAMRLRGLRFDGGSHENLARIAYAIYPCATGWTCESAAGLRDKLVDLMGGVSDDTSIGAGSGACAGCDGGNHREQAEVSDGRTADDCGADTGCGGCGGDLHMAGLTTYDPLWNERHKAVCELRNMHLDTGSAVKKLAIALGVKWNSDNAVRSVTLLQKRLIHLLGGDQPSGIDVMNGADLSKKSVGAMSKRAMDEREDEGRITDELREYVDTALKMHDGVPCYGMNDENDADHNVCYVTEGKLLRIADRIDEQFDRICQQQEAVLQSIIDEVVKEYEHDRLPDQLRNERLVEQRDHWQQQATDMMDRADDMERQRDELQAKLDAIRDTLDG